MPEVAEVVVLYALLTVAGAAAVALARSALRHWWEQRAGRVYELPVERAGTVLRGAGSALAAAVAITLGVCLPPGPGSPSLSPHRQVTAAGPPSSPRPRPVPSDPADAGLVPPRTLGHPAGGTLHELSDGTRVWLPPQYDYPDSAGLYFPWSWPTSTPPTRICSPASPPSRCGASPTPSWWCCPPAATTVRARAPRPSRPRSPASTASCPAAPRGRCWVPTGTRTVSCGSS